MKLWMCIGIMRPHLDKSTQCTDLSEITLYIYLNLLDLLFPKVWRSLAQICMYYTVFLYSVRYFQRLSICDTIGWLIWTCAVRLVPGLFWTIFLAENWKDIPSICLANFHASQRKIRAYMKIRLFFSASKYLISDWIVSTNLLLVAQILADFDFDKEVRI